MDRIFLHPALGREHPQARITVVDMSRLAARDDVVVQYFADPDNLAQVAGSPNLGSGVFTSEMAT